MTKSELKEAILVNLHHKGSSYLGEIFDDLGLEPGDCCVEVKANSNILGAHSLTSEFIEAVRDLKEKECLIEGILETGKLAELILMSTGTVPMSMPFANQFKRSYKKPHYISYMVSLTSIGREKAFALISKEAEKIKVS